MVNTLQTSDTDTLEHLIERHGLNPAQALAVRNVLDGSITISGLTEGAGAGKSETLVACIKAVIWQQGYQKPQNP